MERRKKIALVAHDAKKTDLLDWVRSNMAALQHHDLYAAGPTRTLLQCELDVTVHELTRGTAIRWSVTHASDGQPHVDQLIFFWDQLESLAHEPDNRAILRVATLWNIPIACNRASADALSSRMELDQRGGSLTQAAETGTAA